MSKNGGGLAFPFEQVTTRVSGMTSDWSNHSGLSKREYFAIRALQGMLAHNTRYNPRSQDKLLHWHSVIAKESCDLADALLRELGYIRKNPNLQDHSTDVGKMIQQQWVSVEDYLPNPGEVVLVYSPPQSGDYPDSTRTELDFIDPDSEEPRWHIHGESYEHFCVVAKGGADCQMIAPTEKAPYTHWMPLPECPTTTE